MFYIWYNIKVGPHCEQEKQKKKEEKKFKEDRKYFSISYFLIIKKKILYVHDIIKSNKLFYCKFTKHAWKIALSPNRQEKNKSHELNKRILREKLKFILTSTIALWESSSSLSHFFALSSYFIRKLISLSNKFAPRSHLDSKAFFSTLSPSRLASAILQKCKINQITAWVRGRERQSCRKSW